MPSTPLEEMEEFLEILVASRRELVQTVLSLRAANAEDGQEVKPSTGSNWGSKFLVIQNEIEAAERAVAEEKRSRTKAASTTVKTIPTF